MEPDTSSSPAAHIDPLPYPYPHGDPHAYGAHFLFWTRCLIRRWANHTILQEQLTNEKAMVEIQHRSSSTLSLKTLPAGSMDTLADCMQPKPHDKEGKRRFDLSRIEVTSPLYKMLTQPSVLQLGLTAGSNDVSKTLLSYFETPMAVRNYAIPHPPMDSHSPTTPHGALPWWPSALLRKPLFPPSLHS